MAGSAGTTLNAADGLVMRYSATGRRAVFALESGGGGGGWTALHGSPASSASGNAIAVRGNTTVVVGDILSSTRSESLNQVVLGWKD